MCYINNSKKIAHFHLSFFQMGLEEMLKAFCNKHTLFNSRWLTLALRSSVVWKLLSEVMSYMQWKYVSIPLIEVQLRGPRQEFWLRWETSSSEPTAEAGGNLSCWDQQLPFCCRVMPPVITPGRYLRLWTKVLPVLRNRISKVEMRFKQPGRARSAAFKNNGEKHAVLEHLLPR